MDWNTLAIAMYLACVVVYFALRDQKKLDRMSAQVMNASALATAAGVDQNVAQFATVLTEQRLRRGPSCL